MNEGSHPRKGLKVARFSSYMAYLRRLEAAHSPLIQAVVDTAVAKKGSARKSLGSIELTLIGVLNRSSDVVAAIRVLRRTGNWMVAEAVIRLRIDNLIYLSYLLSLEPSAQKEFADELYRYREPGDRVRSPLNKKKLWERELVKLAKAGIPEIEDWYNQANNAVHLSHHLIFTAIADYKGIEPRLFVKRSERFSGEQVEELLLGTMILTAHLQYLVRSVVKAPSVDRPAPGLGKDLLRGVEELVEEVRRHGGYKLE
jgi:hypothetical protein